MSSSRYDFTFLPIYNRLLGNMHFFCDFRLSHIGIYSRGSKAYFYFTQIITSFFTHSIIHLKFIVNT